MAENNIYPIFDRMLSRADKEILLGQRSVMVWFTGLSGSGKSTIAIALERELQSRGVLCRILDGDNTIETTVVHPESFEVAETLLSKIGFNKEDLKDKEKLEDLRNKLKNIDISVVAKELNVGEMTLADIIEEISKPGRDPREDMPKPILRSDVLKLEDLKEGMILTGTVRNVIDFGAFVDIGVKHDGLVHISEISDKFIKSPAEVVSVGDIVKVKVIKIDMERQKVGLSMKI